MPANNEVEMTEYLIEHKDGTNRYITVPSSWKVTFGPSVVGRNTRNQFGAKKVPMAIRFYESKERQKAIFTDVLSFRDTSIKMHIEEPNPLVEPGMETHYAPEWPTAPERPHLDPRTGLDPHPFRVRR